ncbi:hypothetical protein C8F04DRAFT_1235069 [Mycena alexandri]|uniref:Uncharacterized protein n=1 Tax=Mycena alexandri TaxID=1745969 RepID=A0AAD6SUH9_9AGAR|nr:hypothetical protein C8F04DRAFT_1235069 [Mycena alexandri]
MPTRSRYLNPKVLNGPADPGRINASIILIKPCLQLPPARSMPRLPFWNHPLIVQQAICAAAHTPATCVSPTLLSAFSRLQLSGAQSARVQLCAICLRLRVCVFVCIPPGGGGWRVGTRPRACSFECEKHTRTHDSARREIRDMANARSMEIMFVSRAAPSTYSHFRSPPPAPSPLNVVRARSRGLGCDVQRERRPGLRWDVSSATRAVRMVYAAVSQLERAASAFASVEAQVAGGVRDRVVVHQHLPRPDIPDTWSVCDVCACVSEAYPAPCVFVLGCGCGALGRDRSDGWDEAAGVSRRPPDRSFDLARACMRSAGCWGRVSWQVDADADAERSTSRWTGALAHVVACAIRAAVLPERGRRCWGRLPSAQSFVRACRQRRPGYETFTAGRGRRPVHEGIRCVFVQTLHDIVPTVPPFHNFSLPLVGAREVLVHPGQRLARPSSTILAPFVPSPATPRQRTTPNLPNEANVFPKKEMPLLILARVIMIIRAVVLAERPDFRQGLSALFLPSTTLHLYISVLHDAENLVLESGEAAARGHVAILNAFPLLDAFVFCLVASRSKEAYSGVAAKRSNGKLRARPQAFWVEDRISIEINAGPESSPHAVMINATSIPRRHMPIEAAQENFERDFVGQCQDGTHDGMGL